MTSKAQDVRRDLAETLASGYGASRVGADRRSRDEKVAGGFRRDDRMERLIALRASDRAAFAVASRGLGMRLAFYENAKAAAERLEGENDAA
jgi:hypothetical protein